MVDTVMVGPFISDPTLANIRTTLSRNLVDSCIIHRVTDRTRNALGSSIVREALTALPCSYSPPGRLTQGDAEQLTAGGIGHEIQGVVKLGANTIVKQDDRFEVTIAETNEVLMLDVVFVRLKTREFTRRVLCKLITPASDTE